MRKKLVRRRTIASAMYHALFLLIVYVIQALVLPYFTGFPAIPLILPLAAVAVAMFEGGARGAAMGLIAGALCDMSFLSPIAAFTLILTVLCLVIGVLAETVVARGLLSYFVISVLTLVLCAFAQMFALLFFEGVDARALFIEAGKQTAVSIPFCFALYPAARAVYRPEADKS